MFTSKYCSICSCLLFWFSTFCLEYLVLGNEQEDTDGNKDERRVLKEEVKRKSIASKSEAKSGPDVENVQANQ